MLGPSCKLPTAFPGRWIEGRPPDMVASCGLSGWPHLTNKQSRTWQRQSPEQGGGERLAPLITGPHPLRFATGLQQRAIRAVLRYRYGHSSGQTASTKARNEHPYWLGGRKGIRPVKTWGVVFSFGWGGAHRDGRCLPSPLSSPRSTKIQNNNDGVL